MSTLHERPHHVPKGQAMAALGISRAQAYADTRRGRSRASGRTIRALSAAEREQALALLHSERFCDQTPRQVYARLLSEGVVTGSISTLYRLLRTVGEVRLQRPPQRRAVPGLAASAAHQV